MHLGGPFFQNVARSAIIALLAILAFTLHESRSLQRIDHLLYDSMLIWQDHRIKDDILLIAIDDQSLQSIGRWPWSRRLQAEILDIISTFSPKAVGFDILFSEPQLDDPGADQAFAAALRRSGRTVLAVAPNQPVNGAPIAELLPVPELAAAAARIGHVDIEIDADGLCRSFFTQAGIGNPHWPAFALAMLQVGGDSSDATVSPDPGTEGLGWMRHGRFYVPFDSRPDAIETISVSRLLADSSVGERIRNRYILVGSTATGLGDMVSTPVSFDHQRMPGVSLNGHILAGLLSGTIARDLPQGYQNLLTVALTAIGALVVFTASFPIGVLLLSTMVFLIVALSATLLFTTQLWFAPAASIAPLIALFPFWGAWSLFREKRLNRSLTMLMQHQAMHHMATALPNQYVLEERLRELEKLGAPRRLVALVVINISWSESIGSVTRRPAGDDLLRLTARQVREAVRDEHLVAHLSSDDFGLLVEDCDSADDATRIAGQVLERLRRPIDFAGSPLYLKPRIGISLWPETSGDGEALLRDAFIAVYRARVEHLNGPCLYSADMAREFEAHSQLERALVSAMNNNEFEVFYQPQVSTSDRQLIGVEALLRWHNPELGLVYPGTFIPVAEHQGLIQTLGAWVLRTACEQVQDWHTRGLGPLRLAVNLSPLQFSDGDLVTVVRNALALSGLEPKFLELEITESALMQNLREATRMMSALKTLGINFAIDDFGTGYSSLSHLRHFPLDRIKIDRSFTRSLEDDSDVREITSTIISMAKKLRMEVIAEGVETESQFGFLKRFGCEELQGFLFSHPLPASELDALLESESFNSRPGTSG